MKYILIVLIVMFHITSYSQVEPPSLEDFYSTPCTSTEPFDNTGTATGYFNDPDGDCISNSFVILFQYADGSTTYYNSWDWYEANPDSGGWYDFNQQWWGCCTDDPIADGGFGGGGGDNDENPDVDCSCSWDFNPNTAILTIECDCL